MKIQQKINTTGILSLLSFIIGVLLLIYMITMEGEPGALPLFLILTGLVLYAINQMHFKKLRK